MVPLRRAQDPYRDLVPQLLAEHQMTQRKLADHIGVNRSYLTFVLQGRRAPSRRLLEGTATAFGLPADFFREYREAIVIEEIKADPSLLDSVYRLVKGRHR
jgi:transcriptional regulator with XRE-family HTH domain